MFTKKIALILVGAFLVTACSSQQPAGPIDLSKYQSQRINWGSCPKDYFESSDQLSPSFDKSRIQCGSLNVPALYVTGYSFPDFKIAMMRESARSTSKLGTLFINPGGPGESGVKELQWLNFPKEILDSYDIIGFDPRGVNFSGPATGHQIKCSTQADFETYWTTEGTPNSDAEYLANMKILDGYYKQCSKENPSWWTLNTNNVVDDLELMRSVVTGTESLNFLGSSYGTSIAAQYITKYPKHVGHITLDSPTTNEPTSDASQITDAKATEANIIRLATGYASSHNMTLDEVKKLMLKVRQEGDDDQLVGFAGMKVLDPTNQVHQSSEYMFTHGIRTLTYYDNATAQKYFNQGLEQVSGPQKWNALFEYFALQMDGYDPNTLGGSSYQPSKIKRDNSFEIMDIVDSMDIDYSDTSSKKHQQALGEKIRKVSPFWTALNSDSTNYVYKGDAKGLSWTSLAKSDDRIPDPPKVMPTRTNKSGKQVLIVGARYESTTPYAFAVKTAADLKSPLVTFNGTGHAPLAGFDHGCLNKLFVNYYIHDKLPSGPVTCTK